MAERMATKGGYSGGPRPHMPPTPGGAARPMQEPPLTQEQLNLEALILLAEKQQDALLSLANRVGTLELLFNLLLDTVAKMVDDHAQP